MNITAGKTHAAAVTQNGDVFTWGRDRHQWGLGPFQGEIEGLLGRDVEGFFIFLFFWLNGKTKNDLLKY